MVGRLGVPLGGPPVGVPDAPGAEAAHLPAVWCTGLLGEPVTEVRDVAGRFALRAEDADLIDRVATAWTPGSGGVEAEFLAACKADAEAHLGYISVNRVRELCKPLNVPPRRWSSLWTHNTGPGRPMQKTLRVDEIRGCTSRNDGRPFFLRKWVG